MKRALAARGTPPPGAALLCEWGPSALLCAALVAGCDSAEHPAEHSAGMGSAPIDDRPWFTEITADAGIAFTYHSGAVGDFHLPEIMGAGVAMIDINNNGRLDLYFTNGTDLLPDGSPDLRAGDGATNVLYRHESDGTFTDITGTSGLGDAGYGMGAAVGDVNNDGFADLYVTNYGPDALYLNRGPVPGPDPGAGPGAAAAESFENVTEAAGIAVSGWSCSAAFLDSNRNGFLDLYVTQYVHYDPGQRCHDRLGRLAYCSPSAYRPAGDVLLRNNGDGTFTDVSEESGIAAAAFAGLGVVCDDFNDNGWIDIYVANDGHRNNLWINQPDGPPDGQLRSFRDVAVQWGAAYNLHGRAEAGMGVIAADLRNTLQPDLFMTHLTNESNTLYRNRGDGSGFEDVSAESGLGSPSMPWTGFGVAALDADLRGMLDVIVVNGKVVADRPQPGATLPEPWNLYAEPNLYHRNEGDGAFTLLNGPAAAITAPLEISRGLAVGDLTGNGQVDVVIANIESPARIYRNDAPAKGGWLIVRAIDPALNRDAIGARVILSAGGKKQMRTVIGGFSYLAASDPRAHFGLGDAGEIEFIDIRWPDGSTERFTDVPINTAVELRRGEGELTS